MHLAGLRLSEKDIAGMLHVGETGAMNKPWHAENKMPPKATLEQRIQWHKEHQKHCACRGIPKTLPGSTKIRK